MTEERDKANELRLVAASIIHKLWRAGETTQLELLRSQAQASLDKPYEGEEKESE